MLRSVKALLRSRQLFKNWLDIGIKYWLIKHGIANARTLIVKCRDGGELAIEPRIYSGIVNAYYDGLIRNVNRRGLVVGDVLMPLAWWPLAYAVDCAKSLGFRFDGDRLVIDYLGREVRFPPAVAPFIGDIICENFVGGAYDDLDVRGRVVVDVGAGVGDTALLFALRGAERVIALEPYPSLYRIAKEVVELNNVGDKVVLLNAGVGGMDGSFKAGDCEIGYKLFRPERCRGDVDVRVYMLDSLVREFDVEDAVLKMDCEGCEYEAIPRASKDAIKAFRQVQIEYHSGYEELKRLFVKLGYAVKIKPMKSTRTPLEKQGYIVAGRREQ
ncbi:MAG: FkbM family methyltransferase [Pyrobaculum sp.]